MATTRSTNTTATSALTPEVRRRLKSMTLSLRHLLEDDFRRQLGALGVTAEGVQRLPTGRLLTEEQQRARDVAMAALKREVAGGAAPAEAFAVVLRDFVFTFLNRMIGLRCLEARGLLLVDGQTETLLTQQEELGGVSSLYWRARNVPNAPSQPRDLWRAAYLRACEAVSRDIRVLFDPRGEDGALFPLLPAMQALVAALNQPDIPPAAYAEDAVLGWVYQYFQTEEKDRIFAEARTKKKKIGGADIIPVTQLYTEQYMVDFLLQNSIGRTWMEMYPDSAAKTQWPYYVVPATPHTRPRKPLKDWTILDPCVGSGHFLVVAFDLLAQLYAEERALAEAGAIPADWATPAEEVAQTILGRNLFGIDIDRRATQIATLALYLKARTLGLSSPPHLHLVAADTTALAGPAWEKFLAGFEREPNVRRVLAAMAGYLKDIRELGSLLRPEEELKRLIAEEHKLWEAAGRPQNAVSLFPEYEPPRQERLAFEQISDETFWEQLSYRAEAALQAFYDNARASGDLDEQIVAGEAQRGFAFLELCQRRYDVVCTNPPYMGSKNMGAGLLAFISRQYSAARADLYAAFVIRCAELTLANGVAAMVTQQSWMFLTSFSAFRTRALTKSSSQEDAYQGLLRSTCIECLAHIGPNGFSEISGEVVNVVLFTLRSASPSPSHHFRAYRLTMLSGVAAKTDFLQQISRYDTGNTYEVIQGQLLSVPGAPLAYWATSEQLDLLAQGRLLSSISPAWDGISTTDNEQFVRLAWEVPTRLKEWRPYAKGGNTRRWSGLNQWRIRWGTNGDELKAYLEHVKGHKHWSRQIRSAERQFARMGLTYSLMGSGKLGVRYLALGAGWDAASQTVTPPQENLLALLAYLNSRTVSALARILSPELKFRGGYVSRLPIPASEMLDAGSVLSRLGRALLTANQLMDQRDLTEDTFQCLSDRNVGQWSGDTSKNGVLTYRHSLEGVLERVVIQVLALAHYEQVIEEVGSPAGWHPLLAGYDALPTLPESLPPVPQELMDYLAKHERVALAPEALARLKARLRALYVAGPGAKVEEAPEEQVEGEDGGEGEDEQEGAALGARIPIPAETFLEELSQKLEVHPISVYWLLEEMRRDEGLVCPPEMKRQMEDYASVTLLRELGFRWPEQDTYEAEHGPILDPALVVDDGILPLVECGVGALAPQQIRRRLERDYGEAGAAESEAEFRKWVGRPLEDWLRRDFFKRHISQFKQRPIAWHLRSKEGTFEAFVLYHKLCDEATGRATLQRLRAQYAGGLIERLRAEQQRATASGDTAEVTHLQIQIEDVEDFREKLALIERGEGLKARIRCRWKGDEAREGRPGPYAPDINDGVKVNIRPWQELRLLAAPVIKKWE